METQYNCIRFFFGDEGWAKAHGDCDRHRIMERHWPKETAEGLEAGCSGMENRWKWVWSEAEVWGKLLEAVVCVRLTTIKCSDI